MTWLILVCSHGHRVEWRDKYNGFQHMDAPDTDVCPDDKLPVVVEVVPA